MDIWGDWPFKAGLTACCIVVLTACAGRPEDPPRSAATRAAIDTGGMISEPLFDADGALFDPWTLVPIRGTGNWALVPEGEGLSIRGEASESASAIMLHRPYDPLDCPVIEWRWLAETVQTSADLTDRDKDDVAAGLFILFGDPGTLTNPNRVPTLRYVWTAGPHDAGAIIPNPYMPDLVRNVVVADATAPVGAWRTERRDMSVDFRTAFGREPDDFVHAIALFVDNDQTKEPASVRFASAELFCF